eukprot:10668097-Lingulodinium_polyedra.AAC.1
MASGRKSRPSPEDPSTGTEKGPHGQHELPRNPSHSTGRNTSGPQGTEPRGSPSAPCSSRCDIRRTWQRHGA